MNLYHNFLSDLRAIEAKYDWDEARPRARALFETTGMLASISAEDRIRAIFILIRLDLQNEAIYLATLTNTGIALEKLLLAVRNSGKDIFPTRGHQMYYCQFLSRLGFGNHYLSLLNLAVESVIAIAPKPDDRYYYLWEAFFLILMFQSQIARTLLAAPDAPAWVKEYISDYRSFTIDPFLQTFKETVP